MIRKVILRYLQFRKKSLCRKMEKTVALDKSIHKLYVEGKINAFEYHEMMAYRLKTIDSLNGQMTELDKIINDATTWHLVRKKKVGSSK